ncbi:hypothetical protein ACVSQB_17285 [Bradyrhizobium elkanii]
MDQEDKSTTTDLQTMNFAEFLQTVPPGQSRLVTDFGTAGFRKDARSIDVYIAVKPPPVELHCERCDGLRNFRVKDGELPDAGAQDHYLNYVCSNCRTFEKTFSVRLKVRSDPPQSAEAYKFGEIPAFGARVPNRLLKLLGEQSDNFLKGRRCENQGLGIGAFAYYRRVVESQKNEILNKIIAASRKQGALEDTIKALEEAKSEIQFSKAVSSVKLGLPASILINGHNPLTLLHTALSAGVHEHTDKRCLELAQAVRLVLVELAERLTQALKDEAGLNDAVSQLLKAREASG